MGNNIKALKQAQEEQDDLTKEMLNTMSNMLVQRVAATSAKLKEAAKADESLPIIAIVDKTEKYTLGIKETPNEEVTDGLKNMLSGNFWSGLGQLICGGIKVLLGDTSAGQSESTAYHIVYANNSLLRIDYMMYKYTFSSTGVMSKYENAFCFLLQIGVLDMTKVNPQILLFELTKTIGNENLEAAGRELAQVAVFAKNLYGTIADLDESVEIFKRKEMQLTAQPTQKPKPDKNDQEDEQDFYDDKMAMLTLSSS